MALLDGNGYNQVQVCFYHVYYFIIRVIRQPMLRKFKNNLELLQF